MIVGGTELHREETEQIELRKESYTNLWRGERKQ